MLKWLDNFWYHYKWHVILLGALGIFLLVATLQIVTKEKPDVCILYTGQQIIYREDIGNMKSSLKQVMDDYNGDGEKGVQFLDITMMSPAQEAIAIAEAEAEDDYVVVNPQVKQSMLIKFNTEIVSGDSLLCLLDPYWYDTVKESNGFLPLQEALEKVPEFAVDAYAVRLCDTDFGTYFPGFNELPEETLLCIRRIPTVSFLKGQKREERRYANNLKLFQTMVAFEAPEE